MVVAMSPIAREQIGVLDHGRTGQQLLRRVAAERRGAGEAARLAHRTEGDGPVALGAQVVGPDRRLLGGIAAPDVAWCRGSRGADCRPTP